MPCNRIPSPLVLVLSLLIVTQVACQKESNSTGTDVRQIDGSETRQKTIPVHAVEREDFRNQVIALSPGIQASFNSSGLSIVVNESAFQNLDCLIPKTDRKERNLREYEDLVHLLKDKDLRVVAGTIGALSRIAKESPSGLQTPEAILALSEIVDGESSREVIALAKIALTEDLVKAMQRVLERLKSMTTDPTSEIEVELENIEIILDRFTKAGSVGIGMLKILRDALKESIASYEKVWIQYGSEEARLGKQLAREVLEQARLRELYLELLARKQKKSIHHDSEL